MAAPSTSTAVPGGSQFSPSKTAPPLKSIMRRILLNSYRRRRMLRRQPSLFHGMACDETVAVAARAGRGDKRRTLRLAAVISERAARMEGAAGRRVDRVRHLAGNRLAVAPGHRDVRD